MHIGQVIRRLTIILFYVGCVSFMLFIMLLGIELLFPGMFIDSMPFFVQLLEILLYVGVFGLLIGGSQLVSMIRSTTRVFQEIRKIAQEVPAPTLKERRVHPSYLLADSIDREILQDVKEMGGDLLDIEERVSNRALVPRGDPCYRLLGKLQLLGLVVLSEEDKKLYLTTLGMDALNTPAALFTSKIPESVWDYVFQAKVSLWQEKWGLVVVETAKALEAALKERLDVEIAQSEAEWTKHKDTLSKKPLEQWTAGALLGALRKLEFVKTNSFEDYLASELVKLRNLVHERKDGHVFTAGDADRCDIYLGLLLRSWYGPR